MLLNAQAHATHALYLFIYLEKIREKKTKKKCNRNISVWKYSHGL